VGASHAEPDKLADNDFVADYRTLYGHLHQRAPMKIFIAGLTNNSVWWFVGATQDGRIVMRLP
jgi:hypothetical protein